MFTAHWAMVSSCHVPIHLQLCGFNPLQQVALRCVHVSQALGQMELESSTRWLSKIIHKWYMAALLLMEYGQQKLSVTKSPSHRWDKKICMATANVDS